MDEKIALPDYVLQKQICASCFLYLSVTPIAVNKKGEKICGRCIYSIKFSTIGRTLNYDDQPTSNYTISLFSKYNMVTSHFLYKCINHYEGCRKLLDANEMSQHEKICKFRKNECFFCSFSGKWLQIIYHCEEVHADQLTWDGAFKFTLNGSNFRKSLVFPQKSCIFLITAELTNKNFIITIVSVVENYLLTKQYAVKFFVSCSPEISKLDFIDYGLFNLKSQTCFKKSTEELRYQFGISEITLTCQVMLSQTEVTEKEIQVDKRYKNLRLRESQIIKLENKLKETQAILQNEKDSLQCLTELTKKLSYEFFTCMKCKIINPESIFFCPKSHSYCLKCLSNKCLKCDIISEFSELKEFNKIMVTCDWPKCKEKIALVNYITHKRDCPLRPYKCPLKECQVTVHSSLELKTHWHSKIPDLITENTVEYDAYNLYEFYWLIKKELYHVVIDFSKEKTDIIIEEINVLPNNTSFHFNGCCSRYHEWNTTLNFSNVCGKYILFSKESSRRYPYEKINIYYAN